MREGSTVKRVSYDRCLELLLELDTLLPLEVHAQTELQLRAAQVGDDIVGASQRLLTDGQACNSGVVLLEDLLQRVGVVNNGSSHSGIQASNKVELAAGGNQLVVDAIEVVAGVLKLQSNVDSSVFSSLECQSVAKLRLTTSIGHGDVCVGVVNDVAVVDGHLVCSGDGLELPVNLLLSTDEHTG